MEEQRTDEDLDDLVKEIHKRYADSTAHLKDWFDEAEVAMRYKAGDQWDEDDKLLRDAEDRPTVVFNRVAPFIDAVIGMEVNNRKEVRYIPREEGDADVNELLTGAAEWARDGADAEDEESQAFTDMLTCGIGWVETEVSHANNPDGDIDMCRRDPFRMRYDQAATKRNLSDAQWVLYVGDMTSGEIQQLWPDVDMESGVKGPWDSDIDDLYARADRDNDELDEYATPGNDTQNLRTCKDRIRVVRYQKVDYVPIIRVATAEQEGIQEYEPEVWTSVESDLKFKGIPYKHIRQKKRVISQAYVMGSTLLEKGQAPCEKHFSFSAITGKYDPIKGYYYGLVRPMVDPQKWANAFLSSSLESLMASPKGGVVVEEGAVKDPRKFENTWSDPTAVTWVNPGAIAGGKIQPKPQATVPQALDRLMAFAIQSFPDVTGINLEMLGLAGRDQAGIVETQRKQSGITILAWAFDSLRRYRKEQGRLLAHLISNYLSDGRLIRITGDTGKAQYIPLLREQLTFEYDVIVDEAPTSPNQKERTFQILTELLPALQAMGIPIPPNLLKYSPLPESLTTEWLEYIQQASQSNPQQDRMAEALAADKEAEAQAGMAKAAKDQAEAEQTQLENEILEATGMMP